jgi:hypothetical protein
VRTSDWVMTGIAAQQAMCGSVHYRDPETTVPACDLAPRFLRELFDCPSYFNYLEKRCW